MSQQNQATALLAQFDELNYLPKYVDFQMLLSDKALNIMENFKIDEYGVPQWHIKKDAGDISKMVDIWLIRNRDNLGIDINVKKKKKKQTKDRKKKQKTKRKLNTLQSTFDTNDDQEMNIEIFNHTEEHKEVDMKGTKERKKKKKKRKDKDKDKDKEERSKRKKKRKDKERKKKKKNLYVCYYYD